MTINRKLAVAATAVASPAMSVRSAELGSLLSASVLAKPNGFLGRNLSAAYAGTDARVIADATRVLGRGGAGIGLASNVEQAWRGSERTDVITRDERPSALVVTACEQQQVTDMAHAMGSTGFAGMYGYPSWRTRT